MRTRSPKHHPLHDALCAYLTDPDVRLEVLNTLVPLKTKTVTFQCRKLSNPDRWERVDYPSYPSPHYLSPPVWTFQGTTRDEIDQTSVWGYLEHPVISRGRRVVGNVDVYLGGNLYMREVGTCRLLDDRTKTGTVIDEVHNVTLGNWLSSVAVAIEVKARVDSVGELIRQVNRYRAEWTDYTSGSKPEVWAVCTPNLPAAVSAVLTQNGIHSVAVDPNAFLDWCNRETWPLPPDARALLGPVPSRQLPLPTKD